ncbi:ATP-binding protein [Streptosporangium sp. V21-05]|uniref:ATP-binding protein n=1 Tax=Streptosporangium sp. V21-05 TaxID=3446115 RepID=UPI003F5372CC
MAQDWVEAQVQELRKFGAEATRIEAKSAENGMPKSARESISAFSNTPGGGTLILGLQDGGTFAAVGLDNPGGLQSQLADICRDLFVPPLQPEITIAEIDGKPVVAARVYELPREQKPCYIKSLGINKGSYVRVGDTDRLLTSEEVNQLIAERGQPAFDFEPVSGAEISDLDTSATNIYVERLRQENSRLWENEDNETILRMTRVTIMDSTGVLRPTLAGILSLGRYPQQYFPQLNVTFVHYPTTTGESNTAGVRFLDNSSINGSIPLMVREALAIIQRNMSRRSLISAEGRTDVWEYPPIALREAIVNALVHRDLSPGSRGTQVQIEMYPDRLRILNPGGLFGSVDITRLGEDGRSSARNAVLMRLLEDVVIPGDNRTVCENRGSGIRDMIGSLRRAGMSPPIFRDKVTSFEVIMPNHALLDEETILWLNAIGREGLKNGQCIALAMMRRGEILDNAKYRAASGVSDSRIATFELQDLVARELVDQTGNRGGARYTLSSFARQAGTGETRRPRPNRRQQIIEALRLEGMLSKTQLAEILSISPKTAEHWLRTLKKEGKIDSTESGKSSKNMRYKLTGRALQPSLFDDEH